MKELISALRVEGRHQALSLHPQKRGNRMTDLLLGLSATLLVLGYRV